MSVAVPVDVPLTRREARALERAAQEAAVLARREEVGAEPELTTELDMAAPRVESIRMGAAPSDDVTRSLPATQSRRELRDGTAPAPKAGFAPRAAILSSLGIVTIAAPLTGFAVTQQPASAATSTDVAATNTSVLESIDAAAAGNELAGISTAGAALTASPNAKVLATELASRELSRTNVSVCEPVEGASGFREAFTQRAEAVYRPLAPGTYRDTSQYGPRWGGMHEGTDMAAARGTSIFAVADGTVVHAGEGIEGRSGQLVIIESVVGGETVWTWYGHMYNDGVFVKEGDTVTAGQKIAGVGSNGNSTGPHLHFEVHTGTWENVVAPLAWLSQVNAVDPGQC